nr:hypothetical protein [uncultured Rhodoferax sp.]
MLEVTHQGPRKRTRRQPQPGGAWPTLHQAQEQVLRAWLKSPAQERRWQSLLEAAGKDHLDTAHELLQLLLEAGFVTVKEERVHTQWRPWGVVWTDLEALQRAAGMPTLTERQADKERRAAHLQALADQHPWLQAAVDSCLQAKLPARVQAARTQLLQALVQWVHEERQGLRQDFALAARGHTKALSPAEWDWLEAHVPLESVGLARFEPLLLVAGALGLLHPDTGAQWHAGLAGFSALPCRRLASPLCAVQKPVRYWLIENRACFERQAQQLDDGVCLLWLPGRPGHDWQAAIRWLLEVAPAPAAISCDPDPAGIQIALTAGALWDAAQLHWQAQHMEPARWLGGTTLPLNRYDVSVLSSLNPQTLPPELAQVHQALLHHQCKAEQEAWL